MRRASAWLRDVAADLRHTVRILRKHRGFAATVILTAALGIGATSGVFSIVNAVLLRPLPYPEPDRLVVAMTSWRGRDPFVGISAPKFAEWQRASDAFEAVAAYRVGGVMNLTGGRDAAQIDAGRASAGFFDVFRVGLARGRRFTAAEDRPGGPPIAVVSDAFWRRHMNASAGAVGQRLLLDGTAYDVIGILDRTFDAGPLTLSLERPPELWVPLQLDPMSTSDAPFFVAARLRHGVAIDTARAEAEAAAANLRRTLPAVMPAEGGLAVEPMQQIAVRDVRPALVVLLAAVMLVLAIVCVNTATLLLLRGAARQREIAIRLASGAGRARLVRQLLTESIVLALIGGTIGIVVAVIGVRIVLTAAADAIPQALAASATSLIDARAIGFAMLVSAATGVLFGLAPALQTSRLDLDRLLRSGGDRNTGDRGNRLRALLVLSEMALAVMLLVGAGLLLRSFVALRGVNPGFDFRAVLTLQTAATGRAFATIPAASHAVRDGLERIASVTGVRAAAATLTGTPLTGAASFLNMTVPGRSLGGPWKGGGQVGGWQVISPRYFAALDIPVIAGRPFSDGDDRGTEPVVIVNDTMARQFWPKQNAIGEFLRIGEGAGPELEDATPRRIVGIVGDVRHVGLEWVPRPTAYVPLPQITDAQASFLNRNGGRITWIVRSANGGGAIASAIQGEVQRAASGLATTAVRSMAEVSDASTAGPRFTMWLMAGFGVAALFLAILGVSGVAAYSVRQRTREIGIRLALGAAHQAIRSMVLKEAMRVALAGIAAGTAAALALARLLESLLFGVGAHDWVVFLSMPIALGVVALVAVWLPAQRATAIDPAVALRAE